MQVGDLVKLHSEFRNHWDLFGTVLSVHEEPKGGDWELVSVLWYDGNETDEYIIDLEVLCK